MNFNCHLLLLNTKAATSFFCRRISAVNIKTIPPEIPLRDCPWHSFKDFTLEYRCSPKIAKSPRHFPKQGIPLREPNSTFPLEIPLKIKYFSPRKDLLNTFPQFGFFLGVPLRFLLKNLCLCFPQIEIWIHPGDSRYSFL